MELVLRCYQFHLCRCACDDRAGADHCAGTCGAGTCGAGNHFRRCVPGLEGLGRSLRAAAVRLHRLDHEAAEMAASTRDSRVCARPFDRELYVDEEDSVPLPNLSAEMNDIHDKLKIDVIA